MASICGWKPDGELIYALPTGHELLRNYYFLLVGFDHRDRAGTFLHGIPRITAGTGFHIRNQSKIGWVRQ